MSKLVVVNNLTLDGVMQAPGRPDEDTRDGFTQGGWAVPYADEVSAQIMGRNMGQTRAILLGRRTYLDFADVWPKRGPDNPFTRVLTDTQKFVPSNTLAPQQEWANTTVLPGDAANSVADLKADLDGDIVVLGSGELVQTLMARGLVDEYLLLIHPLVLGSGRLMFRNEPRQELELVDSHPTTTGVIIATYRTKTET